MRVRIMQHTSDPESLPACRLIKGGGVYKNNCKATDEAAEVEVSDLIDGRLLLLAAGKKNKLLVRVEPPGGE